MIYHARRTLQRILKGRATLTVQRKYKNHCIHRPVDTGGQGGNTPPIIRQTCFWRRYKRSLIWQQFWQHYILATMPPPPPISVQLSTGLIQCFHFTISFCKLESSYNAPAKARKFKLKDYLRLNLNEFHWGRHFNHCSLYRWYRTRKERWRSQDLSQY